MALPRLARLVDRLRSRLASPRAASVIVVIGVVVVLPSLWNGLAADDYWHMISLTSDAAWTALEQPWWELFRFFDGNPARTHTLVDWGLAIWWTDPHLAAAFFRPVSAATHLLDYALWPSHPLLMHVQSIAWYAALVGVAAWLYRRLLGDRPWVAAFAGLLYALDHNHGIPVGWIANRNAIVVGVFAIAAIAAHDVAVRGRARGAALGGSSLGSAALDESHGASLGWSLGSAALFALALGSGESSLGVAGFLAAHALFLDTRAWSAKVRSLVPHAAVLLGWVVLYRLGGYGVRGSGMYVEPLREPLLFAAGIAKNLPMLLASELGGPTPDLYTFLPLGAKVGFLLGSLVFLGWSATATMRVLRIDPVARFFVAGGLLATLPACAIFPAGRLLVVPGFGLIGLLAIIGGGVVDGAAWVPVAGARRRLVRSFAIWACGGHLLLSPLVMQIGLQQMVVLNRVLDRMGDRLPIAPVPGLRRIVFINVPDTIFLPYVLLGRGPPGENAPPRLPARLLTLAGGARRIDLKRTDEHTIVMRVDSGFYRTGTELITRNENSPFSEGAKVVLTDVTIEVLHTSADGVPVEVWFRFDESADSDAYLWERWEGDRLNAVKPPAIGEQITIAPQIPRLF